MNVCPDCFSMPGLKRRIVELRRKANVGQCDFHPNKKGVDIEVVAEVVDAAYRDNYSGAIPDPYSGESTGWSLDDVIWSLTGADDEDVVVGLRDALIENDSYWPQDGEEPFYSEEYEYRSEQYRLGETARLWRKFRHSLIHGRRFFNTEAKDLVAEIFRDVHQQRDASKQGPVYLVQPGEPLSTFFRARVADDATERDEIEKDLAQKLGPPPERKRRAGRLNPAGVIGFYGAFDVDTCVAELRPSVGSVVIAAEFAITQPICVLDMTRFDSKPKANDPYAKNAQVRAAQWAFMQSFMHEMARPISPGDEHLDYLPTQAVAEYLNQHHRFAFDGAERTIDAIIYRSAQHPDGKNIVLLGEAALVGQPPGVASKTSDDPEGRWPGLIFQTRRRPKPRLVPKPETVEKRLIEGASFSTRRVYDLGDEDLSASDVT